MQRLGIKIAIASSFLALLLVFSTQALESNRDMLVAETICIGEFTQEPCVCGSSECYEYPDGSTAVTNPPVEVCYNEYTQDECECGSTECSYNPNTATTNPPEECVNPYTQVVCLCDDTQCLNEQPETTVAEPDYTNRNCPFEPRSDRTIIDFTRGGTKALLDITIRADEQSKAYTSLFNAVVTPGIYKVHLASFHYIDSTATIDSYGERWYMELYDSSGTKHFSSNTTHYTDADEIFIQETVNDGVEIQASTYKALAKHASYPDSRAFKFAPLCAAFDLVETLPETTTETTEVLPEDEIAETETQVEEDVKEVYTSPYLNSTIGCSLERKENRILVDFTKNKTIPISNLRISSDGSLPHTKGPIPATLPIGEYTVRISSFGYKLDQEDQTHQEWKLKLLNSKNSVIAETVPSKDIPSFSTGEFTQKIAESIIVKDSVTNVLILHSAYKEDNPNTVAPLCVAFDYNGELPTESNIFDVEAKRITRDIFSPADSAESGVMETTTSVYIQDDTQEKTLAVEAVDIGIREDTGTLSVDENTVLTRTKFITEQKETPFNALLVSSQNEREVLYNKLISEVDVEDEKRYTTLNRESREEIHEEIQREIDEDNELAFESFRVKKRSELAQQNDTDGDGVTDYDEKYIYKTNPENPFTAGSVLTDGERILLGLNPLEATYKPVQVLSPKYSGEVVSELFALEDVTLMEEKNDDASSTKQNVEQKVFIKGNTEPYSFITLFVYSTPIIVTIRSDSEGKFEYTFDETLEDGSHEIYITSVNNTGKILAKSEPIPFIKTAQAIEYTPIAKAHEADPVSSSLKTAMTLLFMLILLLTISVVVWLGYIKSQHKEFAVVEDKVTEFTKDETKQDT